MKMICLLEEDSGTIHMMMCTTTTTMMMMGICRLHDSDDNVRRRHHRRRRRRHRREGKREDERVMTTCLLVVDVPVTIKEEGEETHRGVKRVSVRLMSSGSSWRMHAAMISLDSTRWIAMARLVAARRRSYVVDGSDSSRTMTMKRSHLVQLHGEEGWYKRSSALQRSAMQRRKLRSPSRDVLMISSSI